MLAFCYQILRKATVATRAYDAPEVLDAAAAAIHADRADQNVSHLRVSGGHALDAERLESIVDWIVRTAKGSPK